MDGRKRNESSSCNENNEWIKQIQRLQKTIEIYEQLAEKIRAASVMDRSIYGDES